MKKRIFILIFLITAGCYGMTLLRPDHAESETQPTAQASRPVTATKTETVCKVITGIETGKVNLRGCEGTTCPVLLVLKDGQTLTVLQRGAWSEVITGDGLHGWVNSTYCKIGE